jgi:hypothetical protein
VYILNDHFTRIKSPDMMPQYDIPALVLLWVLFLLLCLAPAMYLSRSGTSATQRRISLALIWFPIVVVGLSFGSLLL